MTLRLALVIDGDASGAKAALAETDGAVEKLGATAEAAGGKARESAAGFEWVSREATEARLGIKSAGEESERAAPLIGAAGEAAGTAAPDIDVFGAAAAGAAGGFDDLGIAVKSFFAGAIVGAAAGVLIGTIEGLIGAASRYAQELLGNDDEIRSALEGQADLIDQIRGAWNKAEDAASDYGLTSTAQLRFDQQQQITELESALEGELNALTAGLFGGQGVFNPAVRARGGGRDNLGPLRADVDAFLADVRAGEADVTAFREAVAAIGEALPAGSPFRQSVQTALEDTLDAAQVEAELERARDILSGLQGDADAAATALGGTADEYQQLPGAVAPATEALTGTGGALDAVGSAAGPAPAGVGATSGAIVRSGEAAAGALPVLGRYADTLARISGTTVQGLTRADLVGGPGAGRGFSGGGWTGPGPVDRIAGFVHGNEYVFDADTTARIGVANLDAIRAGVRGYASGGHVGGAPPASGAAAGSILTATVDDFSLLRGSVKQLVAAVLDGKDALSTLEGAVVSVADRFLDRFLSVLDNLVFTGSASGTGAGGIIGMLTGALTGGPGHFPAAPAPALVPAGLYHGGGRVGPAPALSRMVDPLVFAGAPRMHDGGILPGERAVIAKDGEEIGWPDELARKYGGSNRPLVEVHNHSSARVTERERDDGEGGRRAELVIEDTMAATVARAGSPVRRALSDSYGLRGRVVRR